MRARLVIIMVTLALGATACSGVIAGTALPQPNFAPYNPADANTAFGDFSTVDPCALIDIGALPEDLDAVRQKPESLDYCALKIDVAGTSAYADIGELVSSTGENLSDPEQVAGGLSMYPDTLSYGSCTAYLSFTGNPMYLISEVSSESGDGTDALCTASQEIAKNAAAVIARQRVPHVSGIPAKSLRRLDACSLVDSAVLDAAGLGPSVSFPAKHQCVWNDKANDAAEYVQLLFLVGPSPEPGQDGTTTQIADRQTVVQPTDETAFGECTLETGGIEFGQPQQDLVEIAEVFVYASGQTGAATCQLGTSIANAAWPKLPASS